MIIVASVNTFALITSTSISNFNLDKKTYLHIHISIPYSINETLPKLENQRKVIKKLLLFS